MKKGNLLVPAIGTTVGYTLLVVAALHIRQNFDHVPIFWPATAVIIGMSLHYPVRQWWSFFIPCLLTGIAAEMVYGTGLLEAIVYNVADIALDALIACFLIRKFLGAAPQLRTAKSLAIFVVCAAILAPSAGATVSAAVIHALHNAPYWQEWFNWWLSAAMGIVIVTPLFAVFPLRKQRTFLPRRHPREFMVLLVLAVGGVLVIFAQSNITLLFLITPLFIWAALRFGMYAVCVTAILVTLITVAVTVWQLGPITVAFDDINERIKFFQIYLGSNILPALFIAVILRERRDSETRFRDLFEGSRLGIQVTDRMGGKLLVNQAMVDLLGYDSIEELMAVPRQESIAPYHRDRSLTGQMLLENEDLPPSLEIDLVRKDGAIVPVQVFWRLIEMDGEPVIQRTVVDISERKRAEEALVANEERLRLLLDAIGDGLLGLDADGNCTFCNPAGLRSLGYADPFDLVGHNIHALVQHSHADGSPYRETDCTMRKTIQLGQEIEIDDEVFWRADGSCFPVAYRSLPVRKDGAVIGAVVVFCDLTREIENERILGEHDQTIRNLQRELAQVSRASDLGEMSSAIAHELSQPLTAIRTTANAAQRHLADDSDDILKQLEEMLPHIVDNADRAKEIISSISQLFGGGLRERTVEDINALIDETCDLAAKEFELDGLRIERRFVSNLPSARVDKIQIQQVVYNLLRNSVEAMRETPEKTVVIATSVMDDSSIEVCIHDTGPGIPPGTAAKIFDPFETTKETGMGIGLYTCRTIIEAHSGSIAADEAGGGGAAIRFVLPVAA